MRILLDENVDKRLKRSFPEEHEVVTVTEAGWSGKKNGELLRLAKKEFDVFVTTDKGIPHQQNVPKLGLVVAVLRARSNALEDLEPLMDDLGAALVDATPGTVVRVPPEG
ncbi:MAG: hypothetical protein CYG60_00540 [Actinobacteria bacterium]|nr:MAG: hypothetical protein CYG60_00540 [Actinomycetota bacterium]